MEFPSPGEKTNPLSFVISEREKNISACKWGILTLYIKAAYTADYSLFAGVFYGIFRQA